MAYSADFRERLIRSAERGHSARSRAEVFEVSPSAAVKWVQAYRRRVGVGAFPPPPHPVTRTA